MKGSFNTSTSHKILKIDAKYIKSFEIIHGSQELANSLCYGAFLEKGTNRVDRIITSYTSGEKFVTDSNRNCILYLNWFNFSTSPYASAIRIKYIGVKDIVAEAIDSISKEPVKYYNCVKKPFTFNGKTIDFYGDSITEGFTSGSTKTQNGFPKLFSNAVGAKSFRNLGVGGTCLSKAYNGLDSIITKLKSNLTNSDFCFIAGGINDWQTSVTKEELTTAMNSLCTWLKENYSGTVIFITPINHAGRTPISTPLMTLWECRQIITEIALANGYNVVQGWQFPFPSTDGVYASSMFGDKLHPTELGYTVYAKSLQSVLC